MCTSNFAGVERYVTYVAPLLVQRGWDVTVLGGDTDRMTAALGGVPHEGVESVARAVAALRRCDRSDIVHVHMTAAETAAVAARLARRFPIVTTRHFAAHRGSSVLGRLAAPAIRRSVAEQIAISDFVAGAIGEPSVTIRNAAPDDYLTASRDGRTVLLVQRLEEEKRTADALRAWAQAQLADLGWKLLIAGDGNERAQLSLTVNELRIGHSVEFLGARTDVGALMRQASIFVATAPMESFGLSVVEAMAAGTPVVAARGGAHMETVGSVATRWMFGPGDVKQLAGMLQELAGDDAERAQYGQSLQAHQRANLSLASHVDQLEAVYARVGR
jgi:glycosyltransferase involved in cell wall biosynthesis